MQTRRLAAGWQPVVKTFAAGEEREDFLSASVILCVISRWLTPS